MIHNSNTRRHIALALIAMGGVLFMIAPENSAISLILVGLGILLEILGVKLSHVSRT